MPHGIYDRTKSKPRKKKGTYVMCQVCSEPFYVKRSRFTKAKFCSYKCCWKNSKGKSTWNKGIKGICKPNSKSFKKGIASWNKGKKLPQFSKENSPSWKGGITISQGYVYIHSPNHPFHNNHNYVKRSRLVMEKKLGRYLTPKERVHHVNGIKRDDRPKNLMYFANNSAHIKFHHSLMRYPT